MNYFDQLRQGGPGYEVRDNSDAASFSIYCDQTDDEAIRAFQRVARAAKAHEDGWEVKLAPPRGFKIRSIRGLQDPVYLMAAISKLTP